MPSRKCIYCERRWPKLPEYEDCPRCKERTVPSATNPTLTETEAGTEARYAMFGWHLLNRWLTTDTVRE